MVTFGNSLLSKTLRQAGKVLRLRFLSDIQEDVCSETAAEPGPEAGRTGADAVLP